MARARRTKKQGLTPVQIIVLILAIVLLLPFLWTFLHWVFPNIIPEPWDWVQTLSSYIVPALLILAGVLLVAPIPWLGAIFLTLGIGMVAANLYMNIPKPNGADKQTSMQDVSGQPQ